MRIEFNPAKNLANRVKHGVDFGLVEFFDFETAQTVAVRRNNDDRLVAIGYVGKRLYFLVYKRISDGIRAISLRKANKMEQRRYHEKA